MYQNWYKYYNLIWSSTQINLVYSYSTLVPKTILYLVTCVFLWLNLHCFNLQKFVGTRSVEPTMVMCVLIFIHFFPIMPNNWANQNNVILIIYLYDFRSFLKFSFQYWVLIFDMCNVCQLGTLSDLFLQVIFPSATPRSALDLIPHGSKWKMSWVYQHTSIYTMISRPLLPIL